MRVKIKAQVKNTDAFGVVLLVRPVEVGADGEDDFVDSAGHRDGGGDAGGVGGLRGRDAERDGDRSARVLGDGVGPEDVD